MYSPLYITGDSRNVDVIFKNNNITPPNLILTSPPYFDILNYNNHSEQIGFGQQSYKCYLEEVVQVLQKCFELSSKTATLWLVVDTFRKDGEIKLLPFDIANLLKDKYDSTWNLKEIIIWDKEKNLPWNGKGYFRNEFEYILFFSKTNEFTFNLDSVREINDLKKWWKTYPERYNPDGKAPSNLWSFTTPIRGWGNSRQNHLCPFPFQLIEKIVSLSTHEGDCVLDPFAGSGSVLAISQFMNRIPIGIDINEEYKTLFEKEVMIGAERYWVNRQIELSKNNFNTKSFREINDKLRKLKLSATLASYLNKINNHNFLYLAKQNPDEKNLIDFFILENGISPSVDLNDEELQKFIKQTKITPHIMVLKNIDFYERFVNLQLYKYQFKKFYSYTSSCKITNIDKNDDKYKYLYSDIEVKIFD